jgi:hypothetical protein
MKSCQCSWHLLQSLFSRASHGGSRCVSHAIGHVTATSAWPAALLLLCEQQIVCKRKAGAGWIHTETRHTLELPVGHTPGV